MSEKMRPANLIYSVDERPPFKIASFLSIQHAAIGIMYMIYPILLIQESGQTILEGQNFLSICLLVVGLTTILQGIKKWPIGSGYLAIQVPNPIFLPLSLQSVSIGGYPLLFGMMLITGVFQSFFSQLIQKMRALFPPEVCGVVITMLGISLVDISVQRFVGLQEESGVISTNAIITAFLTLSVLFGITIWFRGSIRLFSLIIGIGVGYMVAFYFDLVDPAMFSLMTETPLIALPQLTLFSFDFNWTLLLPFLITGLVSSLDSAGGIIMCQKFNDSAWKRADMNSMSGGLLADGLGNVTTGVVGGFGVGVSSTNIGLCMPTGCTSRSVGFLTGILFILVAFFPWICLPFLFIPVPVMGAILVYVCSFLIVSGMQLILSRMLDDRRVAMVGLSLVVGMSVEITPSIYRHLPEFTAPFFGSSLAVAAVTAIVLNFIFRFGISRKSHLSLALGEDAQGTLCHFMETTGSGWGARKEVVTKAISALLELTEMVAGKTEEDIHIDAIYDEYNLDIAFSFRGDMPSFPAIRPSVETLLKNDSTLSSLSGYLVQQYADRLNVASKDGVCTIKLHFDH